MPEFTEAKDALLEAIGYELSKTSSVVRRAYNKQTKVSLFQRGDFNLHSGGSSNWKIDCDALDDTSIECLAWMVSTRMTFRSVYGIPTGGVRLAEALAKYTRRESDTDMLIVDDVLTTGRSMREACERFLKLNCMGVVIFARGAVPSWVMPLFPSSLDGVDSNGKT